MRSVFGVVAALALATGCKVAKSDSALAVQQAQASIDRYDPARDLGPLFKDVELAGIFEDSKTFVDARPRSAPAAVSKLFAGDHTAAVFDLRAFVDQNFEFPRPVGRDFQTDTAQTMEEHIRALWRVLTRSADGADVRSWLIPLPNPYVVPGGRFREVYYWDSYFTMLGLVESGRVDLVRNMLGNFAHLVATVGHIPNGHRTYYLGRSQPPFFAAMVGLYAKATDTTQALRYLDALEAERAFWMDGADRLRPGQAYRRVDLSSRWRRDPADLKTLETTELIPIDLNSLLYNAERTIAALRSFRKQPGDSAVAARFNRGAEGRRQSLLTAAYEPGDG